MQSASNSHNLRIVELSGGVGGSRLARGLAAVSNVDLTVVVNVGDDADNHGLHISPDLDTVVYTLAGLEGPFGWGRANDTFHLNDELARFGVDNTFQLGDRDLALKLFRTNEMNRGRALSEVTREIVAGFALGPTVLPATDDRLRTEVRVSEGWISFQEYFVSRGHRDPVLDLRFAGRDEARPAPGVIEALVQADMVVIGPSNPPLSIEPILTVQGVRQEIASHPYVTAVSPLIGGKALKGPADAVMASLGLPPGNIGVAEAYKGLIDRLVIDRSDADDADSIGEIAVLATDIVIKEADQAERLARELLR